MKFNAVFKKVPEGYIGFVEEIARCEYTRQNACRNEGKSPRGN